MAHIPSGATADMELVTFRQALEAANTLLKNTISTSGSMPPTFIPSTVTFWVPVAGIP